MYRRRYNSYRRPYGYRRYGYNRYRYNRYPRSTYRKANSAYYSARKIVRNQETKSFINNMDETYNLSMNTLYGLSNIVQGPGVNERIGRVINPTSLKVKLQYVWNDDMVASAIEFRIVIGYWKPGFTHQSDSKTITGLSRSDIFSSETSLTALKNEDNQYDSIFLYDKVHKFGIESLTKYIEVNLRKKLRKHKIVYNDGIDETTYNVISNNGLFMAIIGAPEFPAGSMSIFGYVRLNYKDT